MNLGLGIGYRVEKRAGCLSLALFLCIILAAGPCLADFRFAVMGDSRGDEDGINTKVLRNFLDQARSDSVDFIVFVGDLITGSTHKEIHTRRLTKWRDITAEYGMPVYIAVGNHEIESEASEDVFRSIFELPIDGPKGLKGLVYSFDYQNARFIILDTAQYNNFHRIGGAQLEWLKENISANKKDIVFVFGHDPAYPVAGHVGNSLDRFPSERDELWGIFNSNKVSVYFCGHEHLYNRSMHDSVCQVITGGAGARPHVKEDKGGFYHFLVVDVMDGGDSRITVKDMKGATRDNFVVKKNLPFGVIGELTGVIVLFVIPVKTGIHKIIVYMS